MTEQQNADSVPLAIEELLTDYAAARSTVIGHTSTSMTRDYRFLAHDIKDRCVTLNVEWRPTFLPMHVRDLLIDMGADDPREGRTVVDMVGEPHPFDPMFCGEGCQPVESSR